MKGGRAMNRQELREAIRKSEEIRSKAMKMAEESNDIMDTDFKKSMDMFLEAMNLWRGGAEIAQRAINEAIDSGMLNSDRGAGEETMRNLFGEVKALVYPLAKKKK